MPDTPKIFHKKLLGETGERRAERYLKKSGMKLLQRNYKTPFGEADLIMKSADEIVFVEVKTRSSDAFGLPSEAVGKDKQRRYRNIASSFSLKLGEEVNARFDVVEVYENGEIRHIPYAF